MIAALRNAVVGWLSRSYSGGILTVYWEYSLYLHLKCWICGQNCSNIPFHQNFPQLKPNWKWKIRYRILNLLTHFFTEKTQPADRSKNCYTTLRMEPTNHCCKRRTKSTRQITPSLPATMTAAFLAILQLCCLLQTATAKIQRTPLAYKEDYKARDRRESASSKVCKSTCLSLRLHSITHLRLSVVSAAVAIQIWRADEDTEKCKRHPGRLHSSSRK